MALGRGAWERGSDTVVRALGWLASGGVAPTTQTAVLLAGCGPGVVASRIVSQEGRDSWLACQLR